MPERTYTGDTTPAGVQFPDTTDDNGNPVAGRTAPVVNGVVEVTDDEAALLDTNPDWGGTAPSDDPPKKRRTRKPKPAEGTSKETD